MEAGVTNHLWSVEELVELIDQHEAKAKKEISNLDTTKGSIARPEWIMMVAKT